MKKLIILIICIVITHIVYSYPWPMKNDAGNFNGPLSISATLGDLRRRITETNDTIWRFHRGVDIARTGNVYPINGGIVKWDGSFGTNAYVRIDNFWYIHLKNRADEGDTVKGITDTIASAVVSIGETNTNHLHFQIGAYNESGSNHGPFENPLLYDSGFDYYVDNNKPTIQSLKYYKAFTEINGNKAAIETTTVREKIDTVLFNNSYHPKIACPIDISLHANDTNNMKETTGLYRYYCCIVHLSNNDTIISLSDIDNRFEQVEPPSNGNDVKFVYDLEKSESANSMTFEYWLFNIINNLGVNNGYLDFDTNRVGIDGLYKISVYAEDMDSNYDSIVDTFIVDYQNPRVLSIGNSTRYGFSVLFNEELKQDEVLNTINYTLLPNYELIDSVYQDTIYNFIYHFKMFEFNSLRDTVYELSLNNIHDYANNPMDTIVQFTGSLTRYPVRRIQIYDSIQNYYKGGVDEYPNEIMDSGEKISFAPAMINLYKESVWINDVKLSVFDTTNSIQMITDLVGTKNNLILPDSLIELNKSFEFVIPSDFTDSLLKFTMISNGTNPDSNIFYMPVNRENIKVDVIIDDKLDENRIWNNPNQKLDNGEEIYLSLKIGKENIYANTIRDIKVFLDIDSDFREQIKFKSNVLYFKNLENNIISSLNSIILETEYIPNIEEIPIKVTINYNYLGKRYYEIKTILLPVNYIIEKEEDAAKSLALLGVFSPNGDGFKDSLEFTVKTISKYPMVETNINGELDTINRANATEFEMKFLRRINPQQDNENKGAYYNIDNNFLPNTYYSFKWDGIAKKQSLGAETIEYIEDGEYIVYFYEPLDYWERTSILNNADGTDKKLLNSNYKFFAEIFKSKNKARIIIDRKPINISKFLFNKSKFSSNYDSLMIYYELSEPGSVWIKILNSNSDTIKYYEKIFTENDLNGIFVWDGTDNAGIKLDNGIYKVCLFAQDFANPEISMKQNVIINNSMPYLTIIEPDWHFIFNSASTIDIIAEFYDPDGIKKYSDSIFIKRIPNNYLYCPSLRKNDSLIIEDTAFDIQGLYYINATISDINGNKAIIESPFIVDNEAPEIEILSPKQDSTYTSKYGDLKIQFKVHDNFDSIIPHTLDKKAIISIISNKGGIVWSDTISNVYYGLNNIHYWNFIMNNGDTLKTANTNSIIIELEDMAKNKGMEYRAFHIDAKPPTISIRNLLSNHIINSTILMDSIVCGTDEFTRFLFKLTNTYNKDYTSLFNPYTVESAGLCTLLVNYQELRNIPDGLYKASMVVKDRYDNDTIIGNILEGDSTLLIIDRTAPQIITAACIPLITEDDGITNCIICITEQRDIEANQGEIMLVITLEDSIIWDTIINPASTIDTIYRPLFIDMSRTGYQQIKITATDKHNNSTEYSTIAAYKTIGTQISYPMNNDTIYSNQVIIKGHCTDPNPLNVSKFSYFDLKWRIDSIDTSWSSNNIWVIPEYRDSFINNRGIIQVGNNNILGYFTMQFSTDYEILLTSYEENGNFISDTVRFYADIQTTQSARIDTFYYELRETIIDSEITPLSDTMVFQFKTINNISIADLDIIDERGNNWWHKRERNIYPYKIYLQEWIGQSDIFGYIPKGLYTASLTIYDTLYNQVDTKDIQFNVKSNLKIDTLFAVPNYFTPLDSLAFIDSIVFSYIVNQNSYINSYIYNKKGLKYSIDSLMYCTAEIQNHSYWDGFINGNPADTGKYWYKLECINIKLNDTVIDSVEFTIGSNIDYINANLFIPDNYKVGEIGDFSVYNGKNEYIWTAFGRGNYYPPQIYTLIDTAIGYCNRRFLWDIDIVGAEIYGYIIPKELETGVKANGSLLSPDYQKSDTITFMPMSNSIEVNLIAKSSYNYGCYQAVSARIKNTTTDKIIFYYSKEFNSTNWGSLDLDSTFSLVVDSGHIYEFYTTAYSQNADVICSLTVVYDSIGLKTRKYNGELSDFMDYSNPVTQSYEIIDTLSGYNSWKDGKIYCFEPQSNTININFISKILYSGKSFAFLIDENMDTIWMKNFAHTSSGEIVNTVDSSISVVSGRTYYLCTKSYVFAGRVICNLRVEYLGNDWIESSVYGKQPTFINIEAFNPYIFNGNIGFNGGVINNKYIYKTIIDTMLLTSNLTSNIDYLSHNGITLKYDPRGNLYAKCDSNNINSKWIYTGSFTDTIYSGSLGNYNNKIIYMVNGNPHMFNIPDSLYNSDITYTKPVVIDNEYIEVSYNQDSIICNINGWDSEWSMNMDNLIDSIRYTEIFSNKVFKSHGLSDNLILGNFGNYYNKYVGMTSDSNILSTFWNNLSNPYLNINNWDINLCYINGERNRDLKITENLIKIGNFLGSNYNDYFNCIHFIDSNLPKTYVPIKGVTLGHPFKLFAINNNNVSLISYCENINSKSLQTLGYLNISDLCGNLTLILDLYNKDAFYEDRESSIPIKRDIKNVKIGDIVKYSSFNSITTPFGRASLNINSNIFPNDTVMRISRVKPEIVMLGRNSMYVSDPVLQILPNNLSFNNGVTITYKYTVEEVDSYNIDIYDLGIYCIDENGTPILLTNSPPIMNDSVWTLTTAPEMSINTNLLVVMEKDELDTLRPVFYNISEPEYDSVLLEGSWHSNDTLMLIVTDPALNIYEALKSVPKEENFIHKKLLFDIQVCEQVDTFIFHTDQNGNFSGYIKLFQNDNYIYVGNATALKNGISIIRDNESEWKYTEGIRNCVIQTLHIRCDTKKPILEIINKHPIINTKNVDSLSIVSHETGIIYYTLYDNNYIFDSLLIFKCDAFDTLKIGNKHIETGVYPYEVFVIDESGNKSDMQVGSWSIDIIKPEINQLLCNPYWFSPIYNELIEISYYLSENCSQVELKICNENMEILVDKHFSDLFSGYNNYIWDGHINDTIVRDGKYFVIIKAIDLLNNESEYVESDFIVISDTLAPVSKITLIDPYYSENNDIYLTKKSKIKISSTDDMTGVKELQYYLDGVICVVNDSIAEIELINLPDGMHIITYFATDNAGNIEESREFVFYLDNTPPELNMVFNNPSYTGDYQFTTSEAIIDAIAIDKGCGVKNSDYNISNLITGDFINNTSILLNALNENLYIITINSEDNLGHTASIDSQFVIDNSEPITLMTVNEPKYLKADTILITSQTDIGLLCSDYPTDIPSSGVKSIYYGYDNINIINSNMVTDNIIGIDTTYLYIYYGLDNLNNTEERKTALFELDNTAPEAIITYPYDGIFINQAIKIKGYINDKNFKDWKLEYREEGDINWTIITDWQGEIPADSILGIFDGSLLSDGYYIIRLTAKDLVYNTTVEEISIKVGEPKQDLEFTGYHKPKGVWADEYIYIADTHNKRIAKVNIDNELLLEIKEFQPTDVYVNNEGKIFVTDHNSKVYIYLANGDELKSISGHLHPKGIEVRDNLIYVADTYRNRIVIYNLSGELVKEIKGMKHPEGIAVDEDGNIFTCLDESNEIKGYNSNGEEIFSYGITGHEAGEFIRVVDIDVDSKGYLWVCDRNNNRVHMIDWKDKMDLLLIGERGVENHFEDKMNKPSGLSIVEEEGRIKYLYIADTNNDRIIRYNFEIVEEDKKVRISSFAGNELSIEQFLPYPNPTRDISNIRVVLNKSADIVINIFTITGKMVYNYNIVGEEGINEVVWTGINTEGENVLNGVYNIQVIATNGNERVERWSKIAIIK